MHKYSMNLQLNQILTLLLSAWSWKAWRHREVSAGLRSRRDNAMKLFPGYKCPISFSLFCLLSHSQLMWTIVYMLQHWSCDSMAFGTVNSLLWQLKIVFEDLLEGFLVSLQGFRKLEKVIPTFTIVKARHSACTYIFLRELKSRIIN